MPMSVRIGLLLHLFACGALLTATLPAQDAAEADQMAQTASRAEAAGEYELAAGQWEQLINEYPESDQLGVACYHAGFCHVQLKQYQKAIERLEQAIRKLDANKKVALAQAWLFLGFAEMKLGRDTAREDPESSSQLLTTAAQTFTTLLNKYPDFEDADQALFFQGESFEALDRLDKAAESYTRMLQLPDPEFKLDGLFALAFIRSRQGKYDEASQLYDRFEAEGEQHPSFNEVRLRSAAVQMELAVAAENLGEADRVRELLQTAARKFAAVADTQDPKWMDQARFRQADCLQRLGQYDASAQLYDAVSQIPGSKLADQARVYAGRDYLRSGNGDAAVQTLEKAVAVASPHAPEAAHWLAQFHLRSQQTEPAYRLAADWIGKAEDPQVKSQLMLDQADAAYASSERKSESPGLYLKITEEFPQQRLAATALYHAAFAAMELKQFGKAIELCQQFRKQYAKSDYLPDAMEVQADSYLLNDNPESSELTYVELVQEFEGHPKSSVWKLRAGLALFMQKKYEQCIQWLTPLVDSLARVEDKAEALHWIGSSHYQAGRATDAVEKLTDSLAASGKWRRADETLLTLSRAQFANKQPEQARKTTQQLIANFPDSPLLAEAGYRLAEFEYDAGNYAEAEKQYRAVVDNFASSQFAAFALYGLGWSQLQQSQFAQAAQSFDTLIEKFPNDSLATQALIGRASSYRQSGQNEAAIKDLEMFLQSDPLEAKKIEALYELGLAQVAEQQWPQVIRTFTQLIDLAPDGPLADRYHYELAWARHPRVIKRAACHCSGKSQKTGRKVLCLPRPIFTLPRMPIVARITSPRRQPSRDALPVAATLRSAKRRSTSSPGPTTSNRIMKRP